MSIFNDKSLKGVAEEASKVMEELKGKQHKLDVAEPKGKLTKDDFDKLRSIKKEAKEYDAPAPDPEAVARRKRLQALQDKREDEAMEKGAKKDKPTIRKVAGKAYGGAKQKDEMDESVSTFSGILENYAQNGLKSFSSIFLKEEPDNEQFTKEVETAQEKSEGKGKKAKVGAAAVQAVEVQKEEFDMDDINDINGVKMSSIDERELSDEEMQKREQYAKGMKKKLSGFKKRYGERAKEVMYATATKMAKKD